MANVNLNQSQVEAAIANIESDTATLNEQLTRICNFIEELKGVYFSNSGIWYSFNKCKQNVLDINKDYDICKTRFMEELKNIVANYQTADISTTSSVSSLEKRSL